MCTDKTPQHMSPLCVKMIISMMVNCCYKLMKPITIIIAYDIYVIFVNYDRKITLDYCNFINTYSIRWVLL